MENLLIETSEYDFLDQVKQSIHTCFVFMYTPLCGTCKLAEHMLQIARSTGNTYMVYKLDANFSPQLIELYKIQSVPCLIVINSQNSIEKHYAFKSVQDVYEIIKVESKV